MNEAAQTIERLKLAELVAGDSLELLTESGSQYKFRAERIGEVVVFGRLERKSDHNMKGEPAKWELVADDEDAEIQLRGSCDGSYTLSGESKEVAPKDENRTAIEVGKCAWFGIMLEGQDHTLITSNVVRLQRHAG
jgi:hypothetical protein